MKQGLLWEECLPLGEMTPEEPDRPQLQKCVQGLAERDVSFSSPTRSQEMSGHGRHGPQWRAVVKDRRLSIHKEAILCIVYLPGPYLGNFNAFLITVKSASLRMVPQARLQILVALPTPLCSRFCLYSRSWGYQGWPGTPAHKVWGHGREPLRALAQSA